MTVLEEVGQALSALRVQRPLIHHITNVVTMNDCANATLAIGASPVMTWAEEEAGELAAQASALVLNIGTLQSWTLTAMETAGQAAAAAGIPIILDPVGAGGTSYRTNVALRLAHELPLAVIRGNLSEITCLAQGKSGVNAGVDNQDKEAVSTTKIRQLAQALGTTVAITGAVDAISDGTCSLFLGNGTPLLTYVTGTGCMTTSLIAAFAAVTSPLIAAAGGILSMSIAGELAVGRSSCSGPGTLHYRLMDSLYQLQADTFGEKGNIVEYDHG